MKLANSLFTPITVFLFLLITPKQCEIKCYSFKGKLDYTHLEGGKEEENRLYILTEFNPDFKKIKWIILQYFVRLCFLKTQLIRYACKFNMGCQLSWNFFFFFFFATIMRRKNWPLVRSCWQLSSSASVLAAEGGMAASAGKWKMALDWHAGCFQSRQVLHSLHRFLLSQEWQPAWQNKKPVASPHPSFPITEGEVREREAKQKV